MIGQVVVRNRRTGFEVRALLGEDTPVASGYGGWEEVTRAKRKGFPNWQAQALVRVTVPLILDGWASGAPQDQAIRGLENMASKRGNQRPPTVKVDGPIPHADLVWVVESLDFGASLKNEAGQVLRQEATLGLMEWEDVDLLAKRKRGRDGPGGTGRRFTRVRMRGQGSKRRPEHLVEVVVRVLGDSSRWAEVRKLNKIKHPRKLKFKQKIRLP